MGGAAHALDDDEFEELGGTQGPSRAARSTPAEPSRRTPRLGFQIGAMLEEQDDALQSEVGLWGSANSKHAISLAPAVADVTASDFMTVEAEKNQTASSKR